MKLRYRDLSNRLDPGAIKDVATDTFQAAERSYAERPPLLQGTPGTDAGLAWVGGAIAGIVSAPRQVSVVEGEAELDELRRMLREGKLQPEDLVNDGTGWATFLGHPLFTEEALEHRGFNWWWVVGLLAFGALVVVAIWGN